MRIGLASLLVKLLLYLSYNSTFLAAHVSPLVYFEDDEPLTEVSRIDRHAYRQPSPSPLNDLQLNNNNRDLDVKDNYLEEERYETTFQRENLTFADLKKDEKKSGKNEKVKLVLGYLTAVKGNLAFRQGLAVSGAISMAIDEINNDNHTLPGVELELRWNDTKGDNVLGTKAMTDMLCDGVSAFFGPEGSCYVEAIVSQARNVPMISYKCSDYRASSIPTFARTEPPDTQVTKSIISLLKYYNWNKFSIVYEEGWKTVADSLENQANEKNMSVQHNKNAMDRHKCCLNNLACCESSFWYQFIQESKNQTRIYVFLGTRNSLVDFMDVMQTARLFENGEYFVISVDINVDLEKEVQTFIFKSDENQKGCDKIPGPEYTSFIKRVQSLFVVVLTVPTDIYSNFSKEVNEYNKREPFNFALGSLVEFNFHKYVSIYAAYLYDSVKLYASALHHLLLEQKEKKKRELLEDEIREISKNGTKIIQTIIQINKTYNSITGAVIKLDSNGDSEGNFSVLAYQEYSDVAYIPKQFHCSFDFTPVGQFYQTEDPSVPQYKINPNTQISWAGGNKPNDEPSCGFNNELCPKSNSHRNSIIAAGILAVILFCAGVITMSIYRKWKIEQEIEGLLWKIDRDDIRSYCEKDTNVLSSPSKISLASASVTSYESKIGLQVFTTTANYRGLVVRIKELNFSRKKDISREVMKEMRILRDLRHDNVNSFIGACVQPTSILLVTDYCAKGSLYDIIENEDIKLDKMFVASLVHDLIKGMLYLHNSVLGCHGNLKSSNCVVTSRWVLQVTDFGLPELRHCAENESIGEHQYYRSLFWRAPEILRHPDVYLRGSKPGDVYAFAIILFELLGRRGPFGNTGYEPRKIVELVRKTPRDGEEPFRPDVEILYDSEINLEKYVIDVMTDCWAEVPEQRPDFTTIRMRLKRMKEGKSKNIMDQMMDMMVTYANNLEELVNERTRLLFEEKNKTEDLLHRMLPKPVAESLTKGYGVEPESYDSVTIYFSDIVGFTAMSAESTPLQVVNFLNDLYTVFDRIIKGYDVYKVETIGDAYMVVSGLPIKNGDRHVGEIASMSLDLLAAVKSHTISHRPKETLMLRIGIHTGPVVAGVVGLTMPRYCLFGDTVNTASRMESNGEALKIHISVQCKEALEKIGGYNIEERGLVNMKGKGEVMTYWLVGATEKAIQRREVDINEYPPLFCRPRRSPRLNNESRQPSFIGGYGGLTNRRHSSLLRDPVGSRLTINSAFGSQMIEESEMANRMGRTRRMLSSIASSSEEPAKSIGKLNRIRESKSLDVLSFRKQNTTADLLNSFLKGRRKSTKSLGTNCDTQIFAIPSINVNNNYPNGNVLGIAIEEDPNYVEDAQRPLLNPTPKASNPIVIKHRGGSIVNNAESEFPKRWHSLDPLPQTCDTSSDCDDKKQNSRNVIIKLLAGLKPKGLFHGNGLKSSQASLKKSVLSDYNNLSLDVKKESIV